MKFTHWLGATAAFACAAGLATSAQSAAPSTPASPFAAPSTLPFEAPPFDRIKDSDYQPAYEQAMAQHLAEIERIANNPAAPTFDNTIAVMERSGRMLERVDLAF